MKKYLLFTLLFLLFTVMAASMPMAAPTGNTTLIEAESAVPPFDLNAVTLEELVSIRGIGPALARRILDYRERVGSFSSIDNLLEVKGIGEKNLARFKNSLTLSPPPSPVATHAPNPLP